jgi:hypothetical protein
VFVVLFAMAKPAHAELTAPRQRVIGRPFPAGTSGNPKGRPIGAKAVFSQDFIRNVHEAWQQHGAPALNMVAQTDPAAFLKVCASLMPRDVAIGISADVRVEHAVSALEAYRLLKQTSTTKLRQIEKVIDAEVD